MRRRLGERRPSLLREHAGDEPLALTDSLDFHSDRLDGLIDLREALDDVVRDRGHDSRAAAPDPPREGDRDRKDGDEEEDAAEDERLLRWAVPDLRGPLDDGARHRRGARDLRVGPGDLRVERLDAAVDRREALLEAGLVRGADLLLTLEPVGDVAALVLQPVHLIPQLVTLVFHALVDGLRARHRLAADEDLHGAGRI